MTLVRPVAEEKQLQTLSALGDDRLRPEVLPSASSSTWARLSPLILLSLCCFVQFREQLDALKSKVYATARPKSIGGTLVNGQAFVM